MWFLIICPGLWGLLVFFYIIALILNGIIECFARKAALPEPVSPPPPYRPARGYPGLPPNYTPAEFEAWSKAVDACKAEDARLSLASKPMSQWTEAEFDLWYADATKPMSKLKWPENWMSKNQASL